MLKRSLLDSYVASTMPKLVAAAKAGKTIAYSDLGINRRWVGEVVGEISIREDSQNHPLLSAIVVRKGSESPGDGFWGLPSMQNVPQGQRRNVWEKERDKVYKHWETR